MYVCLGRKCVYITRLLHSYVLYSKYKTILIKSSFPSLNVVAINHICQSTWIHIHIYTYTNTHSWVSIRTFERKYFIAYIWEGQNLPHSQWVERQETYLTNQNNTHTHIVTLFESKCSQIDSLSFLFRC